MLKKTIKSIDFDGNERSDECYFHLSKTELTEMEMSENGGFDKYIEKVIEAQDNKTIYALFKEIVLSSYGEKSHDGKYFIKKKTVDGETIRLRDEFEQTAAFDELMMELMGDADASANFFNSVIPKELAETIAKETAVEKKSK